MSLNSALTFNVPPPAELRIGFGNLLDDSYSHKGIPLQSERLPSIAEEFKRLGLHIAGWCEGVTPDNMFELAEQTGLYLPHEPFQYSPREHMAIALQPSLQPERTPEFIRYGRPREGFLAGFITTRVAGTEFIVVHHPNQIISAHQDRIEGTEALVEHIDLSKPTVVVGDFNELSFQFSRAILLDMGLIEVHQDKRPVYPNPGFRGKTYPRRPMPTMSLDVMFISEHFTATEYDSVENDCSDHPFLHAVVRRNKSRGFLTLVNEVKNLSAAD